MLDAASAWPVLHGVLKTEESEGKQNSLWETGTEYKGEWTDHGKIRSDFSVLVSKF